MRTNTVNILLEMGVPAGVKGFTYICDAMELFDTDPYYANGKICTLYHEIAIKRDTTASRVERAIRHAFDTARKKGKQDAVEHYLDLTNTQNSHLLHTLYFRCQQITNTPENLNNKSDSNTKFSELKKQIYQELMHWMSKEIEHVLETIPEPRY